MMGATVVVAAKNVTCNLPGDDDDNKYNCCSMMHRSASELEALSAQRCGNLTDRPAIISVVGGDNGNPFK